MSITNQIKNLDLSQYPAYSTERRHSSWLRVLAYHKKSLTEFIQKQGGDISESQIAIESALTWISTMLAITVGGSSTMKKLSNGVGVRMGTGVLKAPRKKLILTCIGLLDPEEPGGVAIRGRYIMARTADTKLPTSLSYLESSTWFSSDLI